MDREYCYCIRWKREEQKGEEKEMLFLQHQKRWYSFFQKWKVKRNMFHSKLKWKQYLYGKTFQVKGTSSNAFYPFFQKEWEERVCVGKLEKEEERMAPVIDGVIELPFVREDMNHIKEKDLKEYCQKIREYLAKSIHAPEQAIHFLFEDSKLRGIYEAVPDCTWLQKILLFSSILKRAEIDQHKDTKEIKVGILDGGNYLTEYVLRQMMNQYRYFTIFMEDGEREGELEKLRDDVYQEEGLMIDLEKMEREALEQADMIIDLCQEGYRYYKYLKEDAWIMAVFFSEQNRNGIFAKRGKRKILYDVEIGIQNQRKNTQLLLEGIYWKNWKVEHMVKNYMKDMETADVRELCIQYQIVLRKVKYLSAGL